MPENRGLQQLLARVVSQDLCTLCGACGSLCPYLRSFGGRMVRLKNVVSVSDGKGPIEIQRKYPGNHMNWWNKAKAMAMLRQAGFAEVYPSGYGQSYSPVLRNVALFDNTYTPVSLYVEARK